MFSIKKTMLLIFATIALVGCVTYTSPERGTWSTILRGASFGNMSETAKQAKKPIYQGQGGKLVTDAELRTYMTMLESDMSDALRKAGIQIQLVGQDVLVLLVRDAFMSIDNPDISADGADTLGDMAKVLAKYDRTFIEITGYTDAMSDQNAAIALSFDMAERVAVFLAQHKIKPVRMFVQGRGAARPIADQGDIGRHMNRRVELRITPVK